MLGNFPTENHATLDGSFSSASTAILDEATIAADTEMDRQPRTGNSRHCRFRTTRVLAITEPRPTP